MITKVICCRKCNSDQIVENGYNAVRNPKYKCKSCGFGGVFETKRASDETKEQLIRSSQERSSSHGLGRIYGVSHMTALRWIKKALELPDAVKTLVPWQEGDVLELDELWSSVAKKTNKCWGRIALCKRTRQVVSWVIGGRDEERCQALWNLIPSAYKQSVIYSDFYATYAKVLSEAGA